MPEEFRTSRGCAHPWQRGILAAIGVVAAAPARAEEAPVLALREVVVSASRSIDRHEIVTLVLILGVLCFAVVTAIMLLRARVRAARQEAAAHETIAALRADLDRANALLQSEPQILVDWAAASDEPVDRRRSRHGRRLRAAPRARLRQLARCRQSAGDGRRGRRTACAW